MELMRAPNGLPITAGLAGATCLGIAWLGLWDPSPDVAAMQFAHYPEFQLEDPTGRTVTQEDF